MLKRAQANNVEAHFRKIWLHKELLEIYFQLRDQWYFGPRKSLHWLENNDPETFQRFNEAYQYPHCHKRLTLLAMQVTKIQ